TTQALVTTKGSKKSASASETPAELLVTAQTNLAAAITAKNTAIAAIKVNNASNFSFYFNLKLAEQVSPGNYLVAKPSGVTTPVAGSKNPNVGYIATFDPTVTDNFGNMLIPGIYTVVVLSIFSPTDPNVAMYKNSWTGNDAGPLPTFTYTPNIPLTPITPTTPTTPSKTK
ncbi:MAG TPA: hypothetical protein VFJ43_16500, partial [Bacteroidia bacterium]|nr:hypothetical protein [Bacteroidia bacterium]